MKTALKKLKFTSLPNQRLGYFATPELTGNIHPVDAANEVINILEDPYTRRDISMKLKGAIGNGGAAKNIVDNLVDVLLNKYPNMEIIENINNFSDWTKRKSDTEL